MSKRRRKGKKRSVAHLKKYQFKKKHRKGRTMARKKRRSSRRGARRGPARRTHRRRRSGGGGGGRGLSALKSDGVDLLMGGLYGMVETKAKADDSFFLNKVPKPLTAVGYTGNIALMLYGATFVTPNPLVRKLARVVATIATYKMGRNGAAFTDAKVISGSDDDLGDENVIDANMMGALEAEGTLSRGGRGESTYDTAEGVPYDDVVQQAGARV